MTNGTGSQVKNRLVVTIILLVLATAYLALVALTFALKADLGTSSPMQYALHAVLVLTAVAYVFFAEAVQRNNGGEPHARLFLLFACLFSLPVLIGRTLGLYALSLETGSPAGSMFNFYAAVSVSRTIEMLSWTLLFPLSVLFFGFLLYSHGTRTAKAAGVTAFLSALCCFLAYAYIVIPSMVLLMTGILGWGILFTAVLILYTYGLVTRKIGV